MIENSLLKKAKTRLEQFHMEGNKIVFDDNDQNPIIEDLLSSARDDVIKARNYPTSWDEKKIESDLKQFENLMVKLAVYDYNQIGMDFETSHTESGVTRQYGSRNKILADVLPFVHFYG